MSTVIVIDIYARDLIAFRGDFLSDLVAHGHKVIAAAPDFDSEITKDLLKTGVETVRFEIDRGGVNPIREIFAIISLWKMMRRRSIETAIFYSPKIVIYGAIAAYLSGIPRRNAMITGLGYGFVSKSMSGRIVALLQKSLYRLSLHLCGSVLFQNEDDMELFKSLRLISGNTTVGVVNGSGVNVSTFPQEKVPGCLTFLMIGRLLSSKGVREYLAAAAEVGRSDTSVRFQLAGWIDDSNPDSITSVELERIVSDQSVEFLGRLVDVRPALANCSVFVLPSYREGTPRSVLEALSTGRAVITTDAPGCRETVVDKRNGFLVRVGSTEDIVMAMNRYIADPNLAAAHGLRSRRIAVEKYDASKVNASILKLLGLASDLA